jgi:hypothetical protein
MLADSLRHRLGDIVDEDADVVVEIDGELFSIIGAAERDGRMILRLGRAAPTKPDNWFEEEAKDV